MRRSCLDLWALIGGEGAAKLMHRGNSQGTNWYTPGHVSLFREADGTLLAGDALATMDMDSWTSHLTRKRELSRPSAPLTPDWGAARRSSVQALADLEPSVVAAGYGLPITGPRVAEELRGLATRFSPPHVGRYVGSPARADEEGVK